MYLKKEKDEYPHTNYYGVYYALLSEKEREVYRKAVNDAFKYDVAKIFVNSPYTTREYRETVHDFEELMDNFDNPDLFKKFVECYNDKISNKE
jgi:hypothetical protein